MRVAYLGRPRQSQLGVAAAVVASIVQAAVAVTMATVQIVYSEYQERRARKQYRKDQARAQADAYKQADAMRQENEQLRSYLDSIVSGQTQAAEAQAGAGSITGLLSSPTGNYILIGGAVLIGYLVLSRRREQ